MKLLSFLFLFTISFTGCEFNKSVHKDLVTGMTTAGDGLSCNNVYITVNDQKVKSTTFKYGQQFFLNFDNIEGFNKEGGSAFPGMRIRVISEDGDTLLSSTDLYADQEGGTEFVNILLRGKLSVGTPIHSGKEYTMLTDIWDKKGKGVFTARMNFEVVPDEDIDINSNKIEFDEVYVWSYSDEEVITDHKIRLNEKGIIIFEGITGLTEIEGKVFPGLHVKAIDAAGIIVLNEEDLLAEVGVKGVPAEDIAAQVTSSFTFKGSEIQSPIDFQAMIWDRQSDATIVAKVVFELE